MRCLSFAALFTITNARSIVLDIQRPPSDVPLDGSIGKQGQLNVPICVGGHNFLVMVDTGSSDLGIVSKYCHRCSKRKSGNPGYDPGRGKTAKSISFANPEGMHCDLSHDGQCAITTGFEDGTGFKSSLFWDDFQFGKCSDQHLDTRAVVGAIYSATGDPAGEQSVDGIIGLAYQVEAESQAATPFDMLVKTGELDDIFSIALCSDHSAPGVPAGAFELGGDGSRFMRHPSTVQWTPIINESFYTVDLLSVKIGDRQVQVDGDHAALNAGGVIVDSGTTDLMVPRKVYKAIVATFFGLCTTDKPLKGLCYQSNGQVGTPLPIESSIFRKCVQLTTVQGYPDIVFEFAGGMSIAVKPRHYLRGQASYCPDQDGYFKMGISDSGSGNGALLGDVFMVGRVSVFDRKNKRVGFAQLDEGDPVCTDERIVV